MSRSLGRRTDDGGGERNRFFEGLARALMGSDRPLIVLAALQRCGCGALDSLPYLLGFEEADRLSVGGDVSPRAWGPRRRSGSPAARYSARGPIDGCKLGSLERGETELAQNAPDRELEPNLLASLHGEAEGNPFSSWDGAGVRLTRLRISVAGGSSVSRASCLRGCRMRWPQALSAAGGNLRAEETPCETILKRWRWYSFG